MWTFQFYACCIAVTEVASYFVLCKFKEWCGFTVVQLSQTTKSVKKWLHVVSLKISSVVSLFLIITVTLQTLTVVHANTILHTLVWRIMIPKGHCMCTCTRYGSNVPFSVHTDVTWNMYSRLTELILHYCVTSLTEIYPCMSVLLISLLGHHLKPYFYGYWKCEKLHCFKKGLSAMFSTLW